MWDIYAEAGQAILRNGQPDPQSKTDILSALDTLETQAYPIYLTHDMAGTGTNTTAYVQIRSVERLIDESIPRQKREVYRLVLEEVPTS